MKKITSVLLVMLLIFACVLPIRAQTPLLTLDVSEDTAFAGDTLRVTLRLTERLPDVGSLEVHLLYDGEALAPQSLTAGGANGALQVIHPTADRPYTGVLFAYDYGTDAHADKAFGADTLLTADFLVREDAQPRSLSFTVRCEAAFDTAFQPLEITLPAVREVRVLPTPSVEIRNYAPVKTVDYRTTLILYADVTDEVGDATVYWLVNGSEAGTGREITLKQMRSNADIQAQYRRNGRTLAVSPTQTIHVNATFFARLAAFFRALFGALPTMIQSV